MVLKKTSLKLENIFVIWILDMPSRIFCSIESKLTSRIFVISWEFVRILSEPIRYCSDLNRSKG